MQRCGNDPECICESVYVGRSKCDPAGFRSKPSSVKWLVHNLIDRQTPSPLSSPLSHRLSFILILYYPSLLLCTFLCSFHTLLLHLLQIPLLALNDLSGETSEALNLKMIILILCNDGPKLSSCESTGGRCWSYRWLLSCPCASLQFNVGEELMLSLKWAGPPLYPTQAEGFLTSGLWMDVFYSMRDLLFYVQAWHHFYLSMKIRETLPMSFRTWGEISGKAFRREITSLWTTGLIFSQ